MNKSMSCLSYPIPVVGFCEGELSLHGMMVDGTERSTIFSIVVPLGPNVPKVLGQDDIPVDPFVVRFVPGHFPKLIHIGSVELVSFGRDLGKCFY